MFKRLFAITLTFGMAATAPPAFAQNCAERESIITKLQESYAEELAFGGLQKTRGAQSVMEVWTSKKTGSYTVLVTNANGISCIVAVGTDFFEAIPKIKIDGTPS
ncbi:MULTISPECIES: hypothetical protein [unclassified Ruegeria]|uniref:hypothetical protein n=1 Tax=unclassified Ruegeria TaxID=2625375 RepID=UPI001488445A|nr:MULTISPECIES: hypothetical protein [unclassified Ruegeria]NOD65053.1 hypothetical protein [Ruegeria sp. HKCCD6109]NOD76029.1 hypothetical protein [Ruegeria sp. HKCCD4332]NOD89988.1 hypothetical protein [Ruegeria sp. HKCCD4318]NOD93904.1 hypothetical protein [Ruegeria sp. HKCCD4884]NOE15061.1 hypothetical protein [Ruegeria sp. HKCCD4318-2]